VVVVAVDSNPEVRSAVIAALPATTVLLMVLPTAELVEATLAEVIMAAQAHQTVAALAARQWGLLRVVVGMMLVEAAHMTTDPEATVVTVVAVVAAEATIPEVVAAVTWSR